MVLVDHIIGLERYKNAISLANSSQIVVLHDAETRSEKIYEYKKKNIISYYKYVCKFSIYRKTRGNYISTLIMSNFIELDFLKEIFENIKSNFKIIACGSED